ncbi:minor capsid protein [Gorillibacterium sp. sgz500922]|uniref:minor capsid protein n=1 Tax=Gorillibacterium sp. sgz500922 TaxID=3446694 RepID=UPI003F66749B
MRSADYWAKRMEQLQESLLGRGDAFAADALREYDRALARISANVERWYGRLAANNEVSLADAKKLLTRGELKEFRWTVEEYIKRGRENAIDQRWAKELENASARVHITRLEQIRMQIRNEVEQLAGRQQQGVTKHLGETFKDGYYKSVYELQKGVGIGTTFAKLDPRQIEATLVKPWAPDGRNFSSRIWSDRDKLVNELQTTLTQNLINGSASDKVISDFAKRMGVSKSHAERLILTESAYFAGSSRLDAYKEMGLSEYEYTATLDSRTSDICRGMDNKRFKLADAQAGTNYPPLHARCRSTTVPVIEEMAPGERSARDDDGSYYTVPADISYKDWTDQHAPEAVKSAEPETPKAVDPAAVKTFSPTAQEPTAEDFGGAVEEPNRGTNKRFNPKASFHVDLPGVSDDALDKLAGINREVARTGYKEAKESVVLVDRSSGEELHRNSGSINKVVFTPEMDAALRRAKERSITLTHNHPRGTRVNIKDALNLARYPSLRDIVAVGHNGAISYVSATVGSDELMFFQTLDRVWREVEETLQKDKKYATLSASAQQEYKDYMAIQQLAKELGWLYGEDFSATKRDPRI